jgi:hypothetical protein
MGIVNELGHLACFTRATCEKRGTGKTDDGQRPEVRGFLNFELQVAPVMHGSPVSLMSHTQEQPVDGSNRIAHE